MASSWSSRRRWDSSTGPKLRGRSGAAADLAARFDLPVLLVVDVGAQVQSAAAVVRGFVAHDPDVRIGGLVLNCVGSAWHRAMLDEALRPLGLPVLGALPREATIVLPERHLGLVQVGEHDAFGAHLARFGLPGETGAIDRLRRALDTLVFRHDALHAPPAR